MDKFFRIKMNSKLIPKYSEDTVAFLQKDYTRLNGNKNFTEGAVCSVILCGLSEYPQSPLTGENIGNTDGVEWCFVSVATERADPDNDEDYVKAEDLKEYQLPAEYYE